MEDRFALLIDADNVSAKYIKPILDELSKYGNVTYKRIYGDWTKSNSASWKEELLQNSITPIQQFSYTQGKNSTDSAMIIDAMDMLYTSELEGFCLVSSDSDFTKLASRLRESGKMVIGMGEDKTPLPFRKACDIFTVLEVLLEDNTIEKEESEGKSYHPHVFGRGQKKISGVSLSSLNGKGSKEKIEKVVLKWEVARAKEYELQVSNDAKKWKTIYINKNGQGATDEIKFSSVSARYVKMSGISRATKFGYSLYEFEVYGKKTKNVEKLTPLHFIRLELKDAKGNLISENFYWRNGVTDLDYTLLNTLSETEVSCKLVDKSMLNEGKMKLLLKNNSNTVSVANRLRLVNKATHERVLPVIMSDNYITLMPGEETIVSVEAEPELLKGGVEVRMKQYGKQEQNKLDVIF